MDTRVQQAFFNECYKKYYPAVFKYIYSKTGDIDTAEDLCQETFFGFSRTMNRVQSVPLHYWAFAIARNIVCTYYRSKKNVSMTTLDDYSLVNEECLHDRSPDYDLRIILEEALLALSPVERTVCENSLIACCTYETTADELKLTLRQVGYRCEQARRRMVTHLQKAGIRSARDFSLFFVVLNIFCKFSAAVAI